jgi:arabinose-5-phosphate isomerase
VPLAAGAPFATFVGGVVLNHLGWAAALGLRAGIFGRQADDEEGRFLRAAMDRLGIERHLILDGEASSVAEILVDDAGGRAIYMAPGATAGTTAAHVRREHAGFIRRARRLTTEVSQLPLEAVREALSLAREAGLETVVDLDLPPSEALPRLGDAAALEAVLRAAQVLKPARAAARELCPDAGSDGLALARALRARYGARAVVVTDGERGCAIAAAGFEDRIPACPAKEVVDTTGAGDAFLGGLLVALHHDLAWRDAGALANACGAACVEKLGAFPDDPAAARARVLELYRGPAFALPPLQVANAAGPADEAARLFDIALAELAGVRRRLDPQAFRAAAALVSASRQAHGRVHVTGVGKPEHVARYAAALLSSTGTPATFLHATEAVHGSAGQLVPGDVLVAISQSGETQELLRAVEAARSRGARVIAVTGGSGSTLAGLADVVLDTAVAHEGGPLGLAPRASVAASVLVVAALAALLEREVGLTRAEYHARHPAGELGRKTRS